MANQEKDMSILLERFHLCKDGKDNYYFDVDEILSLVDYFIETGNTIDMMFAVKLGVELHPDDIDIKMATIESFMQVEEYETALKVIDEIYDEEDEDTLIAKMGCLCRLSRLGEVHEIIDKLFKEKNPMIRGAVEETAIYLNEDKRGTMAYDFIKMALEYYPMSIQLKVELCFYYEKRRMVREALDLCKGLLDKEPYMANVWYLQGRVLILSGSMEKAIDSFDFALVCLDENDDEDKKMILDIKKMKIFCFFENGSYLKAIRTYDEMVESCCDFNDWHVEFLVAQCYLRIDRYETAYQMLKRQMETQPSARENASFYYVFAYCCIEADRPDEAISLFQEVKEKFPNGAEEFLASLLGGGEKVDEEDDSTEKEGSACPSELINDYINNNIHNN